MEQNQQAIEFMPSESQENAMQTLAFAWRRKGLVVSVLIVGLGLGYLYFLLQTPLYESKAQILIVDEQPRLLAGDLELRDSSAAVHVALIRSQSVIDKAVEDGRLEQLATFRNSVRPATHLVLAGLTVDILVGGETTTNGTILELAFESPVANDCPQVLQAVVTAYEEFLSEVYSDVSRDTIGLFEEGKNQLEKQISETEGALRTMLRDSPLLVTGETTQNIHETRLLQIESIRSLAVLENSKLKANIEALRAAVAGGLSRETLNLVVGHIEREGEFAGADVNSRNEDLRRRNDQLFPLLVEEQMLLQSHGAEHPKLMSLRKRIELTREYQDRLVAAELRPKGELPRDYYEVYVESLEERIKMNDQTISEMTNLFEKEREDARGLAVYKIKEETYRSEIDRKSRLFDVVLKRLEEISLTKDRGGAEVQPVHPPSAGAQTQPNLLTAMGVSVVLALMCGLGLAFVVDAADRRFRSPDEIRDDLGIPVIGHIPVIRGLEKKKRSKKQATKGDEQLVESEALPPELRTVHSPRGRIAEAYRAVRTAIYFSIRGGGHRVIQVTSPTPGDGKTTLAANLAVSIANSGKQVLLIDADFRRPRCHRMLRIKNDIGMASVLEDSAEWPDAVQSTEVENLSVLPCGKRPKNPSEMLASRRFEALLEALREKFDLVILDTPPVMAVTDPLNVAPRVDCVILVLRLTKSVRRTAGRTLDALEEVGANILGAVVNGVGQEQRYGYYGGSKDDYSYANSYGYGGNYAYGNGYGYGEGYGEEGYGEDGSNRTYYPDEEATSKTHEGNGTH